MELLTQNQLDIQLLTLDESWHYDSGFLCRNLQFKDFVIAFEFMKAVAIVAEEQNHHPNWGNVYNRVDIRLITHDSGGITMKDIELAREIDRIFEEL